MSKSAFVSTLVMAVLLSASVAAKTPPAKTKMSQEQAVQKAQQHTPGKVLKVTSANNGFKIRVLKKDGRMVDLKVNHDGDVQKEN